MNTDSTIAALWLVPENHGFWRWDEAGEALVWKGGRTVVFREELILILERLPRATLPYATAAFLILSACRGLTPDDDDWEHLTPPSGGTPLADHNRRIWEKALGHLRWLSQLPEHLRRTPEAKANLLDLMAVGANEFPKPPVLDLLRQELPPDAWPSAHSRRADAPWFFAVELIGDTFAHLSPEAIENALRTGLEALPEPAEVELPLGQRVRTLLKELDEDAELSGLAALTREVMAAFAMPRTLPRLDYETPGGFSDLGNRGPLHRLLVSELAHDDDTLASRVILGEALYLRREPSALPPPTTLAVVVDSGLRLWGVPRVLATAVALATLAHSGSEAEPAVFRATADGLVPIRLDRKEDLLKHLEALEPHLHPGAALRSLEAAMALRSGPLEVLLITHPNNLEEPGLLEVLAKLPASACNAATVDGEGHFAFSIRGLSAWTLLSSAKLRLNAILAAPPRSSRRTEVADLPAFYLPREAPLLMPLNGLLRAVVEHPGASGCVGFTNDAELWRWQGTDRGARRCPVPPMRGSFRTLLYCSFDACFVAVTYEASARELSLLCWPDSPDQEPRSYTVQGIANMPERISLFKGALLLSASNEVILVSLQGTILARASLPERCAWLGDRFVGRFVEGRKECFAVGYDGQDALFLPLPKKGSYEWDVPLRIFDPHNNGELVALLPNGRFVDHESGETVMTAPGNNPHAFVPLRDGYRVAFTIGHHRHIVDLRTKKTTTCASTDDEGVEYPRPRRWSVRSKFTHVALTTNGGVRLRAQKGYWVEFRHADSLSRLYLHRLEKDEPNGLPPIPFPEPGKHATLGISLSMVEWPSGARLWLDAHGLIHLRAADPIVPEVSILLAESTSLPAWSSDGIRIGPPFFTDETKVPPDAAGRIFAYLQCFVAGCL